MHRSFSNRIYGCITASFLAWGPSSAHENAEKNTLEPGEGYILVSSSIMVNVRDFVLARHGSKDRVYIKPHGEDLLLKAKAGNYYYKTIRSFFANVLAMPQPEPDDLLQTFEVTEGAITYVGYWNFALDAKQAAPTHDWLYKVEYPPEPMVELLSGHPWVSELPLFVAGVGIKLTPLSWE